MIGVDSYRRQLLLDLGRWAYKSITFTTIYMIPEQGRPLIKDIIIQDLKDYDRN